MKKLISILVLFTSLALTSCATSKSYALETPKIRIESFPKIGEIHTKELGNSLVSEFYVEQAEFIVLKQIPKAKSFNLNFTEDKFKFQGYDKMGRLYYNSLSSGVLLMPNNKLMAIHYTLSDRFAKYQLKEQVEFEKVYEDVESEKKLCSRIFVQWKKRKYIKIFLPRI